MPFITKTLLPKYRIQVPAYLREAIPTIYLGMPPIPLSLQKPLSAPGVQGAKEVKNATTAAVRGISDGSIKIVTKSDSAGGRKRRVNGITRTRSHRKKTNNSARFLSAPVQKLSASSRKVPGRRKRKPLSNTLKRNKNGRFMK